MSCIALQSCALGVSGWLYERLQCESILRSGKQLSTLKYSIPANKNSQYVVAN